MADSCNEYAAADNTFKMPSAEKEPLTAEAAAGCWHANDATCPMAQEAEPFPGGGKGLAVRGGEFAYIKPTGPIIQFDDDEEEEARKRREDKQAGGGADAKAAAKEEKQRAKEEKQRAKEEKKRSKAAKKGAADTNGGAGADASAAGPDGLGAKGGGMPDGGAVAGDAKPDGAAQEDAPMFALHDVNVSVASGELVCVVGRVGSGKTSLVRLRSTCWLNKRRSFWLCSLLSCMTSGRQAQWPR